MTAAADDGPANGRGAPVLARPSKWGTVAITEGACNTPDEKARPLALDGFRTGKSTATGTDQASAAARELQDQPGGCTKDWDQIDDPKWKQHAEAGSAVWLHQGTADDIAACKRDLINFLLSIDATTAVQDIPAGFDACPANEF